MFSTITLFGAALLATACAAPDAELQDKNWVAAEDLIDTSDRIISARFLEEQQVTFDQVDSTNSEVIGEITLLYRNFEVVESFKGTSDAEDTLWVAFEPGSAGELVDGQGSAQRFNTSSTYVLFLKGRLRPFEYPSEFGAALWTGNGEPSFAELQSDRLTFFAERVYLDLLREQRTLPDPLSAAPFELTLQQLRQQTN